MKRLLMIGLVVMVALVPWVAEAATVKLTGAEVTSFVSGGAIYVAPAGTVCAVEGIVWQFAGGRRFR